MAVMMVLLLGELPKSEMSLVTALMNLDLKPSTFHIYTECVEERGYVMSECKEK